jgi:hypothetical protein
MWCLGRRPLLWAGAPAQRGGQGCPPAPCTQSSIKGPPHEINTSGRSTKPNITLQVCMCAADIKYFWVTVLFWYLSVNLLCSFCEFIALWRCYNNMNLAHFQYLKTDRFLRRLNTVKWGNVVTYFVQNRIFLRIFFRWPVLSCYKIQLKMFLDVDMTIFSFWHHLGLFFF